jgi:membrane-bound lytic murein transglycosylase D
MVAIPRPPEMPLPPLVLEADPEPEEAEAPGTPLGPSEEEAVVMGSRADGVAWLADPIFEDPRADRGTVQVPPGLPVPTYPVVITAPVEALIDYFAARERERFSLWIARSGRYVGMIQRIFRERGLPEELAYTAMIESGFNPRAVSRVGAKGMWQFMEATARRYGLVINRWVDERLDPVKATVAAARYLGDLHGMFGHWFLAQAGYNAGEARVARAIQRAGTSDFWALTQTRHLPDETKLFVPQILAATVISRAPARYGFEVNPEPPLAYDEVVVRRPLDLDTVGRLAAVAVDAIRDLNPALLARITPPFEAYTLRLPEGAGARLETALRETPASELPAWRVHRVGRQQSLAEIARAHRVSPQWLAQVNHLPGGRLRGVSEILVPVQPAGPVLARGRGAPDAPAGAAVARGGAVRPAAAPAAREVVVRRGDTLWGIAARHGVRPQALARLNGLDLDDPLLVGTRLRVVPTP